MLLWASVEERWQRYSPIPKKCDFFYIFPLKYIAIPTSFSADCKNLSCATGTNESPAYKMESGRREEASGHSEHACWLPSDLSAFVSLSHFNVMPSALSFNKHAIEAPLDHILLIIVLPHKIFSALRICTPKILYNF